MKCLIFLLSLTSNVASDGLAMKDGHTSEGEITNINA